MALLVQKYGGTSVGSPERILRVAKKIADARARGNDLVVVVSAMGDTTDDLIDLAHRVSPNPAQREMDMLLTAGERISMALLSMALADLDVPALSFTGSQTGIITTEHHRRARIRRILGDRVRGALKDGKVAIVAGFQGVSESKEITTLGRGGSDTTAVALAAALGAAECEIYTDVNGVYSADPRSVPDARFWPVLPYDLMVELASRGAGVLHPRSVELGRKYGIPIRVKNSLSDDPRFADGTVVMAQIGMEEFRVAGVTVDRSKLCAQIEVASASALQAVLREISAKRIIIVSPVLTSNQLSFFSDRDAQAELNQILNGLVAQGVVRKFDLKTDHVPLSVVGSCFTQDCQALSQIIETLAERGILATIGAASALAVTVAVPVTKAEEALRAVHERLIAAGS